MAQTLLPSGRMRSQSSRRWLLLPGVAICVLCAYQAVIFTRLFDPKAIADTAFEHLDSDRNRAVHAIKASRELDEEGPAGQESSVQKSAFRSLETQDQQDTTPWDSSKGIIMALHDRIVPMGVSLIRELRCLGNSEIIQVFHCFDEELSETSRELLTRDDPHVDIIDVCQEMMDRNPLLPEPLMRTFKSYWIKPLALYHTNLTEVILLDADVVMLHDPARVRTLDGYKRTGTTFFFDRVSPFRKFYNRIVTQSSGQKITMLQRILETFEYAKFGLSGMQPSQRLLESRAYKGDSCHEQDSSMVAVDKSKAGKALEVLYHIIFATRFELKFSWGDKEAFWLAYELAHQDYFFSPWGLALVDSVPNQDLATHPETLCGSMAHYIPASEADGELFDAADVFYVNGKALLDPFPVDGIEKTLKTKHRSRLYNVNPTHVTTRYRRNDYPVPTREQGFECVHNQGSVLLPDTFKQQLMRRRIHYFAAETKYDAPLTSCHNFD